MTVSVEAGGGRNAESVLYIGDVGDDTVKAFDSETGDYLGDFVTSGSGGLSGPMGLIFSGGKLALANQIFGSDNGEILRYDGRTGDLVDALVASTDPSCTAPRAWCSTSTAICGSWASVPMRTTTRSASWMVTPAR